MSNIKRLLVLASLAGAAQPASAAPPDGGGGAEVPPGPSIARVHCQPSSGNSCGRTLLRGRVFTVEGVGLAATTKIVFRGRSGRADDVVTRPQTVEDEVVVATVPGHAHSGRITLIDRYGRRASTKRAVKVTGASKSEPVDAAPGSRFFFDGRRRPTFELDLLGARSAGVELVADETQEVLRTWELESTPGQPSTVEWDGKLDGRPARSGTYSFRLARGATGAGRAVETPAPSFSFADHLFPIRGRHNLGYTRTNGFGGGRGHKGQDMFARCGTPLAAARGGRVQYAGYHSAAGYYAVIDGAATGRDYVYMHMQRRALVATGDRVFTGQQIGLVGETGRATGCHLHFEMWTAPGWYEGGRAFDPLPALRRWDSYS